MLFFVMVYLVYHRIKRHYKLLELECAFYQNKLKELRSELSVDRERLKQAVNKMRELGFRFEV
jgi:hypothetical protein